MTSFTSRTVSSAVLAWKHGLRACPRHSRLRLTTPKISRSSASLWNAGHLHSSSFSSSASFTPFDDGAGQPSVGHGGVHDVGGLESLLGAKVDLADPALEEWEQTTHALLIVMVKHGYLSTDELRRHIESMSSLHYVTRSYYCKWATSMALGLIERGVVSYSELDDQLLLGNTNNNDGSTSSGSLPAFSVGQQVRVRSEQSMARWRTPHLRSPGYIFGVRGTVESYEGCFPDPSYKAFRSMLLPGGIDNDDEKVERKEHLYRVVFRQEDVWPEGKSLSTSTGNSHSDHDTVTVEIYENWLQDSSHDDSAANWERDPANSIHDSHSPTADSHDHHHHHHHDHHHDHRHHDHDHDHEHLPRADLEQRAVDLEASSRLCSSGSINNEATSKEVVGDRLSAALIALLSQPQHLGSSLRTEIRGVIDAMESLSVKAVGIDLVIKAWTDSAFEQRLLEDAAAAASELGIQTANATAPTKLKVVKSELPSATHPGVHNLITCTLCSCYPLSMLGLSPKWYKSRSFRARAVREPRAMLQDSFGLDLPPDQWTIRVHDSTADLRYMVLPPRPPGTENWTEDELRQLVTRDTMIGVALPQGVLASS